MDFEEELVVSNDWTEDYGQIGVKSIRTVVQSDARAGQHK
jgi:hypothetical protein